jgi:hypothetical protein
MAGQNLSRDRVVHVLQRRSFLTGNKQAAKNILGFRRRK